MWTAKKHLWVSSISWPNCAFPTERDLDAWQIWAGWRSLEGEWDEDDSLSYLIVQSSRARITDSSLEKGFCFCPKQVASDISRFCHMHKTRIEHSCLKGEQSFHTLSKTQKNKPAHFSWKFPFQEDTRPRPPHFPLDYIFNQIRWEPLPALGFTRASTLCPYILVSGRDFHCQLRFSLPGLLGSPILIHR